MRGGVELPDATIMARSGLGDCRRPALVLTLRPISCLHASNSATSIPPSKPTRTPKPLWGRAV